MRHAFTLIEILVVLVIMGMLTAMVAPKLAGVVAWGEDPIDDANLRELDKAVDAFVLVHERLPRSFVNLVRHTSDGYTSLGVQDVGKGGVISARLADRLLPTLHILNAEEASELKRLGVAKVRNYTYEHSDERVEYNEMVSIDEGVGVMMIGCGAADDTRNVEWNTSREGAIDDDNTGDPDYHPSSPVALDDTTSDRYACMDGGPYVGRIVMGIDADSELVARGYLEAAAVTPVHNARDLTAMLHYAVILPRLSETLGRIGETELTVRRYDDDIEHFYGYETGSETSGATFDAPQRLDETVAVSPHGRVHGNKQFRYGVKVR